ncbi:putative PEP-binding protein [Actinomadura sp. 6N118]|uniref:putative PEP-binding protein n=1 Tax=Actinomadura sp. 6N118 TaxID=3375151 RepID=UPI003799FB41
MSVSGRASWAGTSLGHGLIPYGQGRARGLDAATLGTHGGQMDELISLGLPMVAGLTVPVADAASLTDPHVATAAVELLQQLAGRRLAHGERPMLVRLTASAPVPVAGLPPDLPVVGLAPHNRDAVMKVIGRDQVLHEVWAAMLRSIGEHGLGVAGAAMDDLMLDVTDPYEQVPALLELIAAEAAAPFPDDPAGQLSVAARAMLARWQTPRAKRARRTQKLPADLPLALHVQALALGPWDLSGFGTATSRDAETGAFRPTGTFYRGVRRSTPRPPRPEDLSAVPGGVGLLESALLTLEQHFAAPATLDFELRDGELALLSARPDRAAALANICLAVDLVDAGARDERAAVRQVRPADVQELLHPRLRLTGTETELVRGLPASAGAACGEMVLSSDAAVSRADEGVPVVLVATETTPADLPGMLASAGVITTAGGLASHAAVVARGVGVPAVCGAGGLRIDAASGTATAGGETLREGDMVALDGRTGAVYAGPVEISAARPPRELQTVLGWADTLRKLGVRANADTGRDARTAVELGAEGIGLCRTEHQFLGERLPLIRRVILAADPEAERRALDALAEAQREDFRELLRGIGSRPVTVRLLDAPMHEFLPAPGHAGDAEAEERAEELREANPMLGVRGVRLALLHDRLYPAQAEALFGAWLDVRAEGVEPELEVMIPLVSLPEELTAAARQVRAAAEAVAARAGIDVTALPYRIGSMVETPRAALLAGELARTAQFLSFGTNDLTQLTYGFSRDDVERRVLEPYVAGGLLAASPFERLDADGVGALIEIAVQRARAVRPGIKLGLCGEHGGDPASIELCDRLGLDYVSCSPGRVPIARLAAAQATCAAQEDRTS